MGHSYLNGEGRICTIKETRRSGETGSALIYVDNLGETYFSTGVCTQATGDLEAKAHLRAKYSRACMLCGCIDAPLDENGVCSHCKKPSPKCKGCGTGNVPLNNRDECEECAGYGSPQKALDMQVGGNHYKDLAIQPVLYCQKNNLGFCESSAIKYLTRWRDKGGIEDLKKAKHFIDMLIDMEEENG